MQYTVLHCTVVASAAASHLIQTLFSLVLLIHLPSNILYSNIQVSQCAAASHLIQTLLSFGLL